MKDLTEIFETRVRPRISVVGECWEVNLAHNGNGYRYVRVRPHRYAVHRLSYTVFKGEIPQGKHVLHKCDNRACANPDHLFVGTQLDNIRDMDYKKRRVNHRLLGLNNPAAKLKPEDVIQIRKSSLTNIELARYYRVSSVLIRKVRKREIWKEI